MKISETAIGYDFLNADSLRGKVRSFDAEVYNLLVDSSGKYGTFQLVERDKKGRISLKTKAIRFDFDADQILWTRDVTLQYHSLNQIGSKLIFDNGRKSFLLDNLSGDEVWKLKYKFILSDSSDRIGVGYLHNPLPNAKEKIEGIDFASGTTLWERELSKDYNINNIIPLDRHRVLIASSGLHEVDLRSGEGWSYHAVTGTKDYKKATIGTGIGVAVGLLSGIYFGVSGHDLIWQLNSNVVHDSLHIYFASMEKLVKLDKQGNILWEIDLDEDKMSSSFIFKSDNNLVMINRGIAMMNNRTVAFGEPFIAAYDLANGDELYSNEVEKNESTYLSSVVNEANHIYATVDDRVEKFSISNGEKVKTQSFDQSEYGKPLRLMEGNFYLEKNSIFSKVSDMPKRKLYIFTDSANILVLGPDLSIESQIEEDDLYYLQAKTREYKIISNGDHSIIINAKGDRITALKASGKTLIAGNKLFLSENNRLIEIDLLSLTND